MSYRGVVCAALLGLAGAVAAGQGMNAPAEHRTLTPAEVVWGAAPASLPKGASFAVLAGDPTRPGPFTFRAKLPPGFRLMPHWHPTTEYQTVLEGTYSVGMGERFDMAALKALPPGSFSVMPPEMRHFGYTKDGVTLQVHGMGPFTVTYVNAADDPRIAAPAAN
jgi:hypothetical protein